jgi:hypothetical protein
MLTLGSSEHEVAFGCFVATGKLLDQAWSGIGFLTLLLWCRRVRPLGVFGGGSSFVLMFIKTFSTSSAFTLGMIDTWGLCHFFFGHLLPLIIFIAP